jgi:hypothetical protein
LLKLLFIILWNELMICQCGVQFLSNVLSSFLTSMRLVCHGGNKERLSMGLMLFMLTEISSRISFILTYSGLVISSRRFDNYFFHFDLGYWNFFSYIFNGKVIVPKFQWKDAGLTMQAVNWACSDSSSSQSDSIVVYRVK